MFLNRKDMALNFSGRSQVYLYLYTWVYINIDSLKHHIHDPSAKHMQLKTRIKSLLRQKLCPLWKEVCQVPHRISITVPFPYIAMHVASVQLRRALDKHLWCFKPECSFGIINEWLELAILIKCYKNHAFLCTVKVLQNLQMATRIN